MTKISWESETDASTELFLFPISNYGNIFFSVWQQLPQISFSCWISTRNVWRNVHHVQMNAEQCVCFFNVAFFLPPMQKMFLTACVHMYKGVEVKMKFSFWFYSLSFFSKKVIKVICCVSETHCARLIWNWGEVTKLDVCTLHSLFRSFAHLI